MKSILYVFLICLTISCSDVNDNYIKKTGVVFIREWLIPDSSKNLESSQIKVKAEANNGCWKNLYFELKKQQQFLYLLIAHGTYESYGKCPQNIVNKDSIIEFLPTQKGTYIFYVFKSEDYIAVDSMIVE